MVAPARVLEWSRRCEPGQEMLLRQRSGAAVASSALDWRWSWEMAATACDSYLADPGPWAICCVPTCLDWCGWWLRAAQADLGVLPWDQSCHLFLGGARDGGRVACPRPCRVGVLQRLVTMAEVLWRRQSDPSQISVAQSGGEGWRCATWMEILPVFGRCWRRQRLRVLVPSLEASLRCAGISSS